MNKKIILLKLLITALMLLGCSSEERNREPNRITNERVSPAAEIGLGEERAVEIRLGLINETNQRLAPNDDLAGQWVLHNEEGELRAGGHIYTFSSLEPNGSKFPLTWKAVLEPGTYILKWGAPSVGTTIVEFEVRSDEIGTGIGTVDQQTTDEFLIEQAAE